MIPEQRFHLVSKNTTYVEHNKILVTNNIGNTVAIVGNWSEPTTGREHVWVLVEVDQSCL